MNWEYLLQITLPLGALAAWIWSRLDKRFDKIDSKFEKIDFDLVSLKVSMGKLETRVEERTLKVVHVEKTGDTCIGQ